MFLPTGTGRPGPLEHPADLERGVGICRRHQAVVRTPSSSCVQTSRNPPRCRRDSNHFARPVAHPEHQHTAPAVGERSQFVGKLAPAGPVTSPRLKRTSSTSRSLLLLRKIRSRSSFLLSNTGRLVPEAPGLPGHPFTLRRSGSTTVRKGNRWNPVSRVQIRLTPCSRMRTAV